MAQNSCRRRDPAVRGLTHCHAPGLEQYQRVGTHHWRWLCRGDGGCGYVGRASTLLGGALTPSASCLCRAGHDRSMALAGSRP